MIINAGIEKVIIRDTESTYREINVSEWIENDDSLDATFGY
jgi:dCMP deaminase